MAKDDVYEHDSTSRCKWAEKTIEATGDLAGYPLDPRKTRSQFHITYFSSEVVVAKKCFMMFGYDNQ